MTSEVETRTADATHVQRDVILDHVNRVPPLVIPLDNHERFHVVDERLALIPAFEREPVMVNLEVVTTDATGLLTFPSVFLALPPQRRAPPCLRERIRVSCVNIRRV